MKEIGGDASKAVLGHKAGSSRSGVDCSTLYSQLSAAHNLVPCVCQRCNPNVVPTVFKDGKDLKHMIQGKKA